MNKKEYLKEFKKRLKYQVDMYPISIQLAFYNYGVFVKTKMTENSFEINLEIPIPELVKIIRNSLLIIFPYFTHKIIENRELTSEEIRAKLQDSSKISLFSIMNERKRIDRDSLYRITKIHTRDKTFVLDEDGKEYLYKYPDDIKNIKKYLEGLISNNLFRFVFGECFMIKEYKKEFAINIRYLDKQMINFIKLNKNKVNKEAYYDQDKNCWVWGRYNLFFGNKETSEKCLFIIGS